MPISKDIEQTYNRFGVYIDELKHVMAKHNVHGVGWRIYPSLLGALKNKQARDDIGALLRVVAALDGGKAVAGTIGMIVALSVGGVGIAAMGTAYGLSAATITLIGTACGALIGNEFDGSGRTKDLLGTIGYLPSKIYLGHLAHPRLAESVSGTQAAGVVLDANKAENGSIPPRIGKIDGAELHVELFERFQEALLRIEIALEEVKITQEKTDRKTAALSQQVNLFRRVIAETESLQSAAIDKIILKLEELATLETKLELLIDAQRSKIMSIQQRVESSRLDLSAMSNRSNESMVVLFQKSNRILLVLSLVVILLTTLIILILRQT